jgi:hypothetical protein
MVTGRRATSVSKAARVSVVAWPWLLAVAVLLPALSPGYVLTYDMVFVPDLALRPDFFGFASGLPRAVPSDALVAVLDEVVPGMVLQKLVLLGSLGLAGAGVQRLVPPRSTVARLVATSVYLWSPFVAERLVLGHWPILLAYAALPWVVDAATRSRRAPGGVPPALVLWLALGATSAAGGLMTGIAALLFGSAGASRTLRLVGWVAAVNAPWAVAGLLHAPGATSDSSGAAVFAAGPEGGLPAPLAVLGLGGVWNADVVPAGRGGVAAWMSLLVLLALAGAGVRPWLRATEPAVVRAAAACAALGLATALAGLVAPGALAWLVATVPGGGLLRDGTRFLGLWAVVLAPVAGHGGAAVVRMLSGWPRAVLAGVVVMAPVLLLPGLAWGVAGRLEPVDYPAGWARVREAAMAQSGPGDLLVLPFTAFRAPVWNGGRTVLDPVGRYLPHDYLANDELRVSGRVVAGEDPRARRVASLLRREHGTALAEDLAEEGIGSVVTDVTAVGATDARLTPRVPGRVVVRAGGLTLVALDQVVTERSPGLPAILGTGAAWLALVGAYLRGLVGALPTVRTTVKSHGSRLGSRPMG